MRTYAKDWEVARNRYRYMENRKRFTDSLVVIGQPLILNVLSVLSTAYIIRILGAHGYGQWAVALALSTVMIVITSAGIRSQFVRSISRDPANAEEALADQLGLRAILGVLAGVIVVGICLALGYPTTIVWCAALCAVSLLLTSISSTLSDLVQGMQQLKLYAVTAFAAGFVLTVVSVIVVGFGGGPIGLAASYVIGPALSTVLLAAIIQKKFFPVRIRFSPARVKELLMQARALGSQQLFSTLCDRLEQLVLPKLVGVAGFGYFAAGSMPAARLVILPDGLTTTYYPAVSKSYHRDPRAASRQVTQLAALSLALCLPVAVLVAFLAPVIADILFPRNPDVCRDVLLITIWSVPLLGLSHPIGCALQAAGRDSEIARSGIMALIVSTTTAVVLMLMFGLYGACWAWIVRPIALMAFQIPIFVRVYPTVLPRIPYLRVAFCTAAMALVLWLSRQLPVTTLAWATVGTVLACLVYGALIILLRVFGDAIPLARKRAVAAADAEAA